MLTLASPIEADVLRLRHEFISMPGLRLTERQTARLLGVRLDKAIELLAALEREGFLARNGHQQFRLALPLTA